jgi:hypothetical protein
MSASGYCAILIHSDRRWIRPWFYGNTDGPNECGSLPTGMRAIGPIPEHDVTALVDWLRTNVAEISVQVLPVEVTETSWERLVMYVDVEDHGGCARAIMQHRPPNEVLISAHRNVGQVLFVTMPRTRDVFHAFSLVADGTLRELGEHRSAEVFAGSLATVGTSDEAPSPTDFELVARALSCSCLARDVGLDHGSAMGRGRLSWSLTERLGASLWFERSLSRRPHVGSSEEFETLAIVWTDTGAMAVYHERDTGTLRLCEDAEVVAALRRISSAILRQRDDDLYTRMERASTPLNPFEPGPWGVYASGDPVLCLPHVRWTRAREKQRSDPDFASLPESLRVYLRPHVRKKLEARLSGTE